MKQEEVAAETPRKGSKRVARRRAETRDRILRAAALHFAARGPESVRLEQVAEEADVARGTLYSHFPTKEGLIQEVLRPALDRALHEASGAGDLPAVEAIDRLLLLYLDLWRDFRDPLRLAYRMAPGSLGALGSLHEEFLRSVWSGFAPAARAGLLRAEDPVIAARILSRLAVPMLELVAPLPRGDALFLEGMRGLLLRDRH